MKSTLSAIVLFGSIVLPACSDDPFAIDVRGVDGIEIGMPQATVDKLVPGIGYYGGGDCVEGVIKDKGLKLLLEQGRVARVYISNPAYKTADGIKVGSTEAEAKAIYGDALKVGPHKYVEHAHYMSSIDADGKGILFETDGVKITTISIGVLPALEYVEGCL